MQTAGSGPVLVSTAVNATLPVTASGHLGNPGSINNNLARRHQYLREMYKREYKFSEIVDGLTRQIRQLEKAIYFPVVGYAKLESMDEPIYSDRWMGLRAVMTLNALRPVHGLRLHVYRPKEWGTLGALTLDAGDITATAEVPRGSFVLDLVFPEPVVGQIPITISASEVHKANDKDDQRLLSVVVDQLELVH